MNVPATLPGIGVLVGRFQVPTLHDGHTDLFNDVFQRHEKVIVFLGSSPIKASRHNPLPFRARKAMIEETFKDNKKILAIKEIKDVHNEELWSQKLDESIRKTYPDGPVTLYGSRDGFIPSYRGIFPTVELEARRAISGSDIRSFIDDLFNKEDSNEFASEKVRQAWIACCFDRFPTSYTTVDAVVLDRSLARVALDLPLGFGIRVLMGSKPNEKGKWRMIGGFVDINLDDSCEEAVKRELMEESSLRGVGEPVYIGSAKIPDWRYKNEQDGIMTIIYEINDFVGEPKAADDIAELKWFELTDVFEGKVEIVPEHHIIVEKLRKHITKNK